MVRKLALGWIGIESASMQLCGSEQPASPCRGSVSAFAKCANTGKKRGEAQRGSGVQG